MFIEDIFGRKDSAAYILFVSGQPTDFIPNIFSPNNDGEYDDFVVEYGNMKLDHFQVFDRWGIPKNLYKLGMETTKMAHLVT